jgi:hypothetical protein
VNWIYILGTIGIISSIIGSARNRANQRQQNNIAAGVLKAQQIQQIQQLHQQRAQQPLAPDVWPPTKDNGQIQWPEG